MLSLYIYITDYILKFIIYEERYVSGDLRSSEIRLKDFTHPTLGSPFQLRAVFLKHGWCLKDGIGVICVGANGNGC